MEQWHHGETSSEESRKEGRGGVMSCVKKEWSMIPTGVIGQVEYKSEVYGAVCPENNSRTVRLGLRGSGVRVRVWGAS